MLVLYAFRFRKSYIEGVAQSTLSYPIFRIVLASSLLGPLAVCTSHVPYSMT